MKKLYFIMNRYFIITAMILLFIVLFPHNIFASQFTPVLIAKSKDTTFRMPLVSADLKIKLNDQRAAFQWLLIYRNPTKEWLEGELSMPMLNNQLITAFDMNIKDVLRKGMLAEKQQAKTVYERIVSRSNDPGLLEIINGNTFKLRIFPIMGEELKTIRLAYECDYNYKDGIFSLNYPFDFIDNLKKFNIEIDAEDMSGTPFIESNIDGLKFDDSKFAEKSIENFSSKNFFKIMFRNNLEQPLTTFSEFNDEMYFSSLYKSPLNFESKEKPEHVTLLVDASYSQRKNNFYLERHFLKEYLKRIQNTEIKIIVFSLNIRDEKVFTIKDGNSDELISYLEKIEYLGATNYGCLNLENITSDLILFLSNGVNNMGIFKLPNDNIPIYFLNSNPDYDESFIRRITDKTNGRFINLAKNSDVFSSLDLILKNSALMNSFDFAKSEVSDLQFTKYNENPDIYRITGKMKKDFTTIIPLFGSGQKSDSIVLDTDINEISDDISIPRLWANARVTELSAASVIDTSAIVKISKEFSFATKFSSFIVLETVWQYYDAKIDPPPDLKSAYKKLLKSIILQEKRYAKYIKENEERLKKYSDSNYIKKNFEENKSKINNFLNSLKISYFNEHKHIYDEIVRLAKIHQNSIIKIADEFLPQLYYSDFSSNFGGLYIPQLQFNKSFLNEMLENIYLEEKGIIVDSIKGRKFQFKRDFLEKISPKIDRVQITLKNNDTYYFPVKVKPGVITLLNFDQIFNKKFYKDVDLTVVDKNGKLINNCYLSLNDNKPIKIKNGKIGFKKLLFGRNNIHLVHNSINELFSIRVNNNSDPKFTKIIDTIQPNIEVNNYYSTLIGTVKDCNGKPLRGASISIEGTLKGAAVRNSEGQYKIAGIKAGTYNIRYSYTGFPDRMSKIKLDSNSYTIVNVELNSENFFPSELCVTAEREGLGNIITLSTGVISSGEGYDVRGGQDENTASTPEINIDVLSNPNISESDRIFELTEKLLKQKDTSNASIVLSGIYDIDMESAKNMFKSSAYFSRIGKVSLAMDAINRSSYFYRNSVERMNLYKARIYENAGYLDSALNYYKTLDTFHIDNFWQFSPIGTIEQKKLNFLKKRIELDSSEKIDLIIRSESYDFLHSLNLEITDTYGITSKWYSDVTFFGGFKFSDPTENIYYYQKQAVPGKYKIKAKFNTRNNQTEEIEKYRGRIIIERNIGSETYEKKIIEVESDSLDKEFEFEI